MANRRHLPLKKMKVSVSSESDRDHLLNFCCCYCHWWCVFLLCFFNLFIGVVGSNPCGVCVSDVLDTVELRYIMLIIIIKMTQGLAELFSYILGFFYEKYLLITNIRKFCLKKKFPNFFLLL